MGTRQWPPDMPILTDAQVANLAATAGWQGDDRVKAIAVALAEHSGKVDSSALGDVALKTAKWGPSVGVWQIRSLNAEKGTGGIRDETSNLDAYKNATHAHAIWASAGNSFSPWSTYISGKYLLYMGRAKAVAGGASVGGSVTDAPTETDVPGWVQPLKDVATVVSHIAGWATNPQNWIRLAVGVIGAGLVLFALSSIASNSGAVQNVRKVVP